ncbi:MAG: DUF559 domain-containing protein [Longimicrobiales bacterium]
MKRGRLHRLHYGVYRVGPRLSPHADVMAGVLACGPRAAVSHVSAAALWSLVHDGPHGQLHIIDPVGDHRRPGLRIHHKRGLRSDEVTRLHGIPITNARRTLLDLTETVDSRTLERVVAEAYARRLATPGRLRRLLERHPTAAGAAALRHLLDNGSPALTRSEAEERFLAVVRDAQLPAPEVNVRVAGYEVDFFWPAQRLVVEIDGRASHASPAAFERDRRRDGRLVAEGLRVIRVTWRQLVDEPMAVIARVARALGRAV